MHKDNFNLAGTPDFIKHIISVVEEELAVSKVEKDVYCYKLFCCFQNPLTSYGVPSVRGVMESFSAAKNESKTFALLFVHLPSNRR